MLSIINFPGSIKAVEGRTRGEGVGAKIVCYNPVPSLFVREVKVRRGKYEERRTEKEKNKMKWLVAGRTSNS